ncbi:MAG: hypothetical protein CMN27_15315 [Salinisphaera sp.]|nr:hypothetical protein [Salinisphaera sp.]
MPEGNIRSKFTLKNQATTGYFGLVQGGWLPMLYGCATPNMICLLDTNVFDGLTGAFRNKKNGNKKAIRNDLVEHLYGSHIIINPMLYAMESPYDGPPPLEDFASRFREGVQKLKASLPKATVLDDLPRLLGAYGLTNDASENFSRTTRFLKAISGFLKSPVPHSNKAACWDEILDVANEHNISASSITLTASLIAVASANQKNAARNVLKFRGGYNDKNAYNAAFDLFALEILLLMIATDESRPIQLCTRDRNLALLWAGLQPNNIHFSDDNSLQYNFTPAEDFLPSEFRAKWKSLVEST